MTEQEWYLIRAKYSCPLDHHEVQAHAQIGQAPRSGHRVGGRRAGHHEAGGAEDPVPVGAFHRLVDALRQAEIVGRDDDPACAQAALFRSRMNWKNSTPSRSRRFIICGLRTISPTIEAIFGARK